MYVNPRSSFGIPTVRGVRTEVMAELYVAGETPLGNYRHLSRPWSHGTGCEHGSRVRDPVLSGLRERVGRAAPSREARWPHPVLLRRERAWHRPSYGCSPWRLHIHGTRPVAGNCRYGRRRLDSGGVCPRVDCRGSGQEDPQETGREGGPNRAPAPHIGAYSCRAAQCVGTTPGIGSAMGPNRGALTGTASLDVCRNEERSSRDTVSGMTSSWGFRSRCRGWRRCPGRRRA